MGMETVVNGLKKMVSDKTLSNLKDYHLPIMIFMFLGGGVLAWFGKMTYAFVAFTGTIVGGITGHAFSPAQKDKDDGIQQDPTSQALPEAQEPNQGSK